MSGLVAERLEAAMNARDIDAFVAFFDEEYDSKQPAHPDRAFRGRDQVRQNWSPIFDGVPDFSAELVAASGGRHRVERVALARHPVGRHAARHGRRDRARRPRGRLRWARLYVEPVEQGGAGIDAAVREMSGEELKVLLGVAFGKVSADTGVFAGITTSIDGYIAGPDDGPGKGLGEEGERLHYSVFGGRGHYDEPRGDAAFEDAVCLVDVEVAGRRRGRRPLGTRGRPAPGRREPVGDPVLRRDPPAGGAAPGDEFTSSPRTGGGGARREAAGDKDVHVMGGADVLRQALDAGLVDELSIVVAPVILGGGKRLFEGFTKSLDLSSSAFASPEFATFIDYRVN